MRGVKGKLLPGDIRRLTPLWDALAADAVYRQAIGPKLLSCCLKNTRTSPGEMWHLLRVVHRQFNISTPQIAKKYIRYFVLRPLATLKSQLAKTPVGLQGQTPEMENG